MYARLVDGQVGTHHRVGGSHCSENSTIVMSRVEVVVEGGSEGANSCAELTEITEHSHHRVGSRNSVAALSMVDTSESGEEPDDITVKVLDDHGAKGKASMPSRWRISLGYMRSVTISSQMSSMTTKSKEPRV